MKISELIAKRAKRPPTICHPDRRVSDVLETMRNEGLASIPVVHKGELVAVLSIGELLAAQEEEKVRDTLPTHDYVTEDFSGPKPNSHADDRDDPNRSEDWWH
ncbi:CBS domain-containing protein [Candidatus Kaiserbacteria bacterium]|nr:CBS domain-containing protein [Candidatus Kaiserbacteria bacterium]